MGTKTDRRASLDLAGRILADFEGIEEPPEKIAEAVSAAKQRFNEEEQRILDTKVVKETGLPPDIVPGSFMHYLQREDGVLKHSVLIRCRECDAERRVFTSDLHQTDLCKPCRKEAKKASGKGKKKLDPKKAAELLGVDGLEEALGYLDAKEEE